MAKTDLINSFICFMLEQVLKNQGLTDKEITVFTLLAELGEQPASIISRKSELSRSSSYAVLDQLLQKGLVSRIYKNGISVFQCNELAPLLENLRRRKTAEIKEINLLKINLQTKGKNSFSEPQKSAAHYFSGGEGLENLINQILFNRSTVKRIYLSKNPFTKTTLKGRLIEHSAANGHSNGAVKILSPEKLSEIPELAGVIAKTVPAAFDLGVDLIISGDKLALISFPENFGLLIESRLIASAQAKIFDLVWRLARD